MHTLKALVGAPCHEKLPIGPSGSDTAVHCSVTGWTADAPLLGATSVGAGGGVCAAAFAAVTAAMQIAMITDRYVIGVCRMSRVSRTHRRRSCIGTIS